MPDKHGINFSDDIKENSCKYLKHMVFLCMELKKMKGISFEFLPIQKTKSFCEHHNITYIEETNSYINRRGCRICNMIKIKKYKLSSSTTFVKKSSIIHNNLYNYDFVEYTGPKNIVKVVCPFHGIYEILPIHHLYGRGCPNCKTEYNTKEFIYKSKLIFGQDTYDYSCTQYITNRIHVKIMCKKHNNIFIQTPSSHLQKANGCGMCKNTGYSKKSIEYLNFIAGLYNIAIQHAHNKGEYRIESTAFRADGYCEETNTVYEFHGDFWHGNPDKYIESLVNPINNLTFGELYRKTIDRENCIRSLGYNLVVIWERKWDKFISSVKKIQCKFRKKIYTTNGF